MTWDIAVIDGHGQRRTIRVWALTRTHAIRRAFRRPPLVVTRVIHAERVWP